MKRETPPFAALGVVAATAAIFVYFSCTGGGSGTDPKTTGTGAEVATNEFTQEMGDDDVVFDPAEADFKAVLISGCADISVGSPSCTDQKDATKVGQGQ